jgi:cyclic pyranopterin phosphate synthase
MVDITEKPLSFREATAVGFIKLRPETVRLIKEGRIAKGDPLMIAKLAGISAAKQTSSLIPLTHQIPLTDVTIDTAVKEQGVEVKATVRTSYKTGCEIDALTAATIALVTIFDLVKPYEKDEEGQYPTACIEGLKVLRKRKEPPR